MATVPPGDIATLPGSKVVFNAPFDDKHTYYMKVGLVWIFYSFFVKIFDPINFSNFSQGDQHGRTSHRLRLQDDQPATPQHGAAEWSAGPEGRHQHRHLLRRVRPGRREHQQRPRDRGVDQHTGGSGQAVPTRVVPGRRDGAPQEPAHRVQPVKNGRKEGRSQSTTDEARSLSLCNPPLSSSPMPHFPICCFVFVM